MALLESKATPEELEDYRRFILTLADKVAAAHREEGQEVSPAEAAAIDHITGALGTKESLTADQYTGCCLWLQTVATPT